MERRIYIVVFLIVLFSQFGFAQKKTTTKRDTKDDCLIVVGFFYNKTHIKKITAYLYEGQNIVDSVKTNSMKDFGFILKKNKEYTVKVVSAGYYPRLISVNTALPDDVNTVPNFIFEFDITLMPIVKGADDFFTDFPIALVDFDHKIQKFTYNKQYTQKIQKELKKVENQFGERKSR